MSRWYQNVLTGAQVEVKTLEEDDFYALNAGNWARIEAPSPVEPVPYGVSDMEEALATEPADEPKDIDEMTVAELREFAAANDIDLGEFTKKADLRELIEASLAEAEE